VDDALYSDKRDRHKLGWSWEQSVCSLPCVSEDNDQATSQIHHHRQAQIPRPKYCYSCLSLSHAN